MCAHSSQTFTGSKPTSRSSKPYFFIASIYFNSTFTPHSIKQLKWQIHTLHSIVTQSWNRK